MLLYAWSNLISVNEEGSIEYIHNPSWSLTEKEAVDSATAFIRDEIEEVEDNSEIADFIIFSVEFQPNEKTLVRLLDENTLRLNKNYLVKGDEETVVDAKQVNLVTLDDINQSEYDH